MSDIKETLSTDAMRRPVDQVSDHIEQVPPEHLADAILSIGNFFHDLSSIRTELGSLTLRQVEVLDQLSLDADLTLATLADRLNLANSTTSALIDRMVRDGLIDRKVNPVSRREVLLNLGTKGIEYQKLRRKIIKDEMEKMMAGLTRDQRVQLLKALYMIGQLINDLKKEEAKA